MPAVVFILAMSMNLALAQDHVYWGGDKIRRADLDGLNPTVLWNFAGGPVAVDTTTGRIYWGDHSTVPAKIKWANLNGTGTVTTLLTMVAGEKIDDLEIDSVNQMIYWSDLTAVRIRRSSITSPSVSAPLLSPATIGTVRDIALDLRQPNPKLYWLRGNTIHKSNLDGSNPQQLTNALGGIFEGFAIDTCTDHFVAIGITGSPNNSVIVRADLADAGNVTPILQDLVWPPAQIGQDPRRIVLDLNAWMMYWSSNAVGMYPATVRRAKLSGINVDYIAQQVTGQTWSGGLALKLANKTCSSIGINKDLQNNTGQIANNIEILIEGSYAVNNHYDGYPANAFSSFTASPAPDGNTLLTWAGPNNDVQPGQMAHVGFEVAGQLVNILGVSWTRDATVTGCAQQVSTNTHLWGSPGSSVLYTNNSLSCTALPRYVGGLKVEWHREHVPLRDLNNRVRRNPIRTDVIRRAPVRLMPNGTARVSVPTAPPGARFGVIVHKVSTNPRLSGPDVTTDFLEFPVQRNRAPAGRGTGPRRIN